MKGDSKMFFKFLLLGIAFVVILITFEIILLNILKKYRLQKKSMNYKRAENSLKPNLNTIKKLEIK